LFCKHGLVFGLLERIVIVEKPKGENPPGHKTHYYHTDCLRNALDLGHSGAVEIGKELKRKLDIANVEAIKQKKEGRDLLKSLFDEKKQEDSL